MIKRISLLVTAALLVATMAMAGLAGPAFAAKTCLSPPESNQAGYNGQTVCKAGSPNNFDGPTKLQAQGQEDSQGKVKESKGWGDRVRDR